jgi:hypothetical protein
LARDSNGDSFSDVLGAGVVDFGHGAAASSQKESGFEEVVAGRNVVEIITTVAATPSIYLLGDAPPERLADLLRDGVAAGPWIVIGCSGKRFGLAEALRSVDRFEQGLYWVSHFHEAPPDELGPDFFTVERNTHWISGFDADCFMAYLLRGLAEFPPRASVKGPRSKWWSATKS